MFRLDQAQTKQLCRLDGGKTTGDARSAGQDASALDGCRGQRVIRIEGIAFGMGDDHVWRQFADKQRESLQNVRVDLKRIIAEIKAMKRCAKNLAACVASS